MKEQLIHILDQSVCLSRKQMKEYLSGTMLPEEMHAAEVHLSACPLCSMAMEGFQEHSEEALAAISSLNSGFLKEHFDNIAPQIHLNSLAPAAAMPGQSSKRKPVVLPLWRTVSVAALLLVAVGVMWYLKDNQGGQSATEIAMATHAADGASAGGSSVSRELREKSPVPAPDAVGATLPAGQSARQSLTSEEAVAPAQAAPVPAPKQSSTSDGSDDVADRLAATAPAPATSLSDRPGRAQDNAAGDKLLVARRASFDAERSAQKGGPRAVSNNSQYNRAESAEKEEKSATRNTGDVASLSTQTYQGGSGNGVSIGGGRSAGTKYVVDGVQAKPAVTSKKAASDPEIKSAAELGDEAYDRGKYSTALAHYTTQMNAASGRERNQAAIRVARCYSALGNSTKAKQMLQQVVENGSGPERRAARRMLRGMD